MTRIALSTAAAALLGVSASAAPVTFEFNEVADTNNPVDLSGGTFATASSSGLVLTATGLTSAPDGVNSVRLGGGTGNNQGIGLDSAGVSDSGTSLDAFGTNVNELDLLNEGFSFSLSSGDAFDITNIVLTGLGAGETASLLVDGVSTVITSGTGGIASPISVAAGDTAELFATAGSFRLRSVEIEAIPEPATAALAGLGLLALAGRRRKTA